MKTVDAEWVHIEDNPPDEKVMCLCKDGKIRFGIPICGDGYFYVDSSSGENKVEFWQEIPNLTSVQKAYWGKLKEENISCQSYLELSTKISQKVVLIITTTT